MLKTPLSEGKILIDNREGKRIPKTINYFGTKNTQIKKLNTGDYCYINNTKTEEIDVAIEFKTTPDLIHSIQDKRIFKQVRRLRIGFPYHYVLVLGNPSVYIDVMQKKAKDTIGFNFNYTKEQWYGAYTSLEQVTKILFATNFQEALTIMDLMFKKCTDEKNRDYLYNEKLSTNAVVNYLSNIQGIGYKTAEKISNELGLDSLVELVKIDRKDLINLNGVGEKTSDLVIRAICG
jgi:ERCC4-type nuclease